MVEELNFIVTYGNHTFSFAQGSKAYIFHTGIYNGIHDKYGIDGLLEYVAFVHDCYLADDLATPLGSLADYIAIRWKKLKKKGRYDVLKDFYEKGVQ